MEVKDLGKSIDSLYALRELRLKKQKEVDAMKAEEVVMRQEILATLGEAGLERASGGMATAGLTMAIQPVVLDWEQVHKYVRAENRFELLQRRIGVEAWRELNSSGILVPGTAPQEVFDISLT